MKKQMQRLLSLAMAACLLVGGAPMLSRAEEEIIAEEIEVMQASDPEPVLQEEAPAPTAEPTAAPTSEPTAVPTSEPTAAPTPEPTEEPTAEPAAEPAAEPTPEPKIIGFDRSNLPDGIAVAYGTAESALGLPSKLTALWSDDARSEVEIAWICIDDGLGGSAYIAEHPDHGACFRFQAQLKNPTPCEAEMPVIEVVFQAQPKPAQVDPILIVRQKTNLSDVDLTGREEIIVEADGEITGGETKLKITNLGVISGGIFHGEIFNEKGAEIKKGAFNGKLTNKADALIRDGEFNDQIINLGRIEGGSFIGYEPDPEEDASLARTVIVENQGEITGGEFEICEVYNRADGLITGGSFAEGVILPDGSVVKPDFEHLHGALEGSQLYDRAPMITAAIDYEQEQLCIRIEGKLKQVLSYRMGEATGEWTPDAEGCMHVALQEAWFGQRMQLILSFLNGASDEAAQTQMDVDIPARPMVDAAQANACLLDRSGAEATLAVEAGYQAALQAGEEWLFPDASGRVTLGAQDAYTILVRTLGSNAEAAFASQWAPSGETVSRQYILLTLDRSAVTVGESVNAAAEGVFDGELNWQWLRDDQPIAASSSYTASEADVGAKIIVRVTAGERSAEAALTVCFSAIQADVDYAAECVNIHLSAAPQQDCTLTAEVIKPVEGENAQPIRKTAEFAWTAGTTELQFALADLGADPEGAQEGDYQLKLSLKGAQGEAVPAQLTLPLRTDFADTEAKITGSHKSTTEIKINYPDTVEVALSKDKNAPDFNLGEGPSFSGLSEGSVYYVWVRSKAVQGERFASRWMLKFSVTTRTISKISFSPKKLNVTWSPDLDVPDISFSNSAVTAKKCSFSWTDAKGAKLNGNPSDVGSYTGIVKLSASDAKWYALSNDTLEYTIEPLALKAANTSVSCEKIVYNGKEQIPQKIVVKIGGKTISTEEFTVSKVSGINYSSVGRKPLILSGNGNVSGEVRIYYNISASGSGSSSSSGSTWSGTSSSGSSGSSSSGSSSSGSSSGGSSWVEDLFDDDDENSVLAEEGDPEGEEYGIEEIDYASDNGEALLEDYLGTHESNGDLDFDQALILYDVLDEPMDYELLPVYCEIDREAENMQAIMPEDAQNLLLVIAQPDADGEYLNRILRMGMDQFKRLYEEKEMDALLFRNGDAEVYLQMQDLFSDAFCKLCNAVLTAGEEEILLEELDFDTLLDMDLSDSDLAAIHLEINVDPVMLEDESEAWEISVWLSSEYQYLDVSALLKNLYVGLNVNGMFDDENADEMDEFVQNNAVMYQDWEMDAPAPLDCDLLCMPAKLDADDLCPQYEILMPTDEDPEVIVHFREETDLEAYRNYVLSSTYAGMGAYSIN